MVSLREQAEKYCASVLALTDDVQQTLDEGAPHTAEERKLVIKRKSALTKRYHQLHTVIGDFLKTAINALPVEIESQ